MAVSCVKPENGVRMTLDDPAIPEFAYHDSYWRFARRVRQQFRFATDSATRSFIDTVLATAHAREITIPVNQVFVRAQHEIVEEEDGEAGRIYVWGNNPDRMIPKPEFVKSAGRANGAGIAYLYLATTEQTAVSEIRPWIGASVSIAQFRITRNLRTLDLSREHGTSGFAKLIFEQLSGKSKVDAAKKQEVVWTDIDNAFSTPVSREESEIDYTPTQILAEAFLHSGYDAIAYRSNFGDLGFNVMLFDVNNAEILNCAPYKITKVEIGIEQVGNHWFSEKNKKPAP